MRRCHQRTPETVDPFDLTRPSIGPAVVATACIDPKLCKSGGVHTDHPSAGKYPGEGLPRPFRARIGAIRCSFIGWGQALSELAPSVGGGATTDRGRSAESAGAVAEVPATQHLRGVLTASLELDPLGLQVQLDLAMAALGLARCIDEIVLPATRQLRELLAVGQRDATQDLLAIEAIRTWLNHRGSFAPPPRAVGPILLACGSRETQLVGLESLALLLRFRRWPCQVLGSRLSTFALKIAAQASGAVGVVVVSNESRGLSRAVVLLRTVDQLGIPVFFAGDAFESPGSWEDVPGRYLGTGHEEACTYLINALTTAS